MSHGSSRVRHAFCLSWWTWGEQRRRGGKSCDIRVTLEFSSRFDWFELMPTQLDTFDCDQLFSYHFTWQQASSQHSSPKWRLSRFPSKSKDWRDDCGSPNISVTRLARLPCQLLEILFRFSIGCAQQAVLLGQRINESKTEFLQVNHPRLGVLSFGYYVFTIDLSLHADICTVWVYQNGSPILLFFSML